MFEARAAAPLPGRPIRRRICWQSPKGARYFGRVGELPSTCRRSCCGRFRRRDCPGGEREAGSHQRRILAATNRALERAVVDGTFRRRSFFFPADVLTLRLPALRERRQTFRCWWRIGLERIGRDARHRKTDFRRGSSAAELRLAGQCTRTGERAGAGVRPQQRARNPAARSFHPDLQRAPSK